MAECYGLTRGFSLLMWIREPDKPSDFSNVMQRPRVGYKLQMTNSEGDRVILFEGLNYRPSPMHLPLGKESASGLISFLCTCEGDTDKEFFDGYTPEQIEFRDTLAEYCYVEWNDILGCRADF